MTDRTEAEALEPCLFCGGAVFLEKVTRNYANIYGRKDWWGVVCRNSLNVGGTCASAYVPSATKEAATKRWNTRRLVREDVRPGKYRDFTQRGPANPSALQGSGGQTMYHFDDARPEVPTEQALNPLTELLRPVIWNTADGVYDVIGAIDVIRDRLPDLLRTPEAIAEIERQGWVWCGDPEDKAKREAVERLVNCGCYVDNPTDRCLGHIKDALDLASKQGWVKPSGEPLAFLYEWDCADANTANEKRRVRIYRDQHLLDEGYDETPLYAAPPATVPAEVVDEVIALLIPATVDPATPMGMWNAVDTAIGRLKEARNGQT